MKTSEILTRTKWNIDPMHSEVGFRVKHLMFTNVRGTFKEYRADIHMDEEDFGNPEINVKINPASVYTADEKRDGHLKSADFFDVENFPEIIFTGTSCKKGQAGHYNLHGDLTIKGITKPISLDVEFGGMMKDPWGNKKAAFQVKGKINRKDWGLNWNAALETGGVLVSEDVWIECEIQLAKQA
jgi:polyisoprenoid-binding protein YceI